MSLIFSTNLVKLSTDTTATLLISGWREYAEFAGDHTYDKVLKGEYVRSYTKQLIKC